MKRVVCSFDPETNPTDAARCCVDMLNSNITSIRNIVKGWSNMIKDHPDDNDAMNRIVDESSYMQNEIDKISAHYFGERY